MLLLEWLVSQSSLVLDAIIPPPPPMLLLEWLLEPNALEWLLSQSSFVLDAIIPPPPKPSFSRLEPNAVA